MPGTRKRMANARRARSEIARTFAQIENDRVGVSVLLDSTPGCLGRVRVFDVLRRLPRLDRDGAETVLRRAHVWPLTTMDNLTQAERQRILQHLPPRVKR